MGFSSGLLVYPPAKRFFLLTITNAGFRDIRIVKYRRIDLPEDMLAGILSADEIAAARGADLHVKSVTVVGVKPAN